MKVMVLRIIGKTLHWKLEQSHSFGPWVMVRARVMIRIAVGTGLEILEVDVAKEFNLGLLMLDSFVPKQRRRKGDPGLAAADLSLDLQKPATSLAATSPEPDMVVEKEEKHKNESDGLEDYCKDFAFGC